MEAIKTALWAVALVLSMGGCALVVLDMPVVHVSAEGHCLRVESPNPAHSCAALPRRYVEGQG
ncbi:MAG: hypothetical protein WCR92_08915 [Candidatus Cloacimonadaceae bacterium]